MTTPVPMEPPADAQALLFDCDGTLVDTLSLYRVCWRQVFGRHGFEMSDEWFEHHAGTSVHDFVAAAFSDVDRELHDAIIEAGMGLFMSSTHLLEPLEHVVAVAREFHGRLPLAVVSAGPGHAVRASLDAVGITGMFDLVVTLEDVARPKPSPDGYLRAMALLDVEPTACVAYEDSAVGMAAARAAGIPRVVDVRWHQA